MMRPQRKTIEVHADWDGLGGPLPIGKLYAAPGRREELFAFEYDRTWLATDQAL